MTETNLRVNKCIEYISKKMAQNANMLNPNGGADRNRTDVQGVAVLCIATLPPHRGLECETFITLDLKNPVKNGVLFTFQVLFYSLNN